MSTHGGTSASAPPATTVTGPDTIGAPAVVGTGLHYARNDHDHGLPALDYNAMQYQDLLGWTFDPNMAQNNFLAPTAAATLQLARIPLPAALTVTHVCLAVASTAGVNLTHSYAALYKSNGVLIGQSADQSAVWTSPYAFQSLVLVGGSYVCTPLAANDFLWAAIYIGTATTLPTFYSASGSLGGQYTSAARARQGTYAVVDTPTLPSITPASISLNGAVTFWMGIS
jgi:hypothetical protein